MKVRLVAPPWGKPNLTKEAKEAIDILEENVWASASVDFYAKRQALAHAGKHAPKGMQQTLNSIIDRKFLDNGWEGNSGYYVKNTTWIRVTFRHQMSLGSDIIDALKVCKKEGIELAVILAANRDTLNVVSPNDAAALISFEKLHREILNLNGALDIPLLIGEMTPKSTASKIIDDALRKNRPRDITIPIEKRR
ncbi:MAG: hypothetical protein J6Y14_04535 [Fibrobacter sp.]|nr:hypothetical protein [Fibrobacter sp.]